MRNADVASDGMVLPIAWNMLDDTNVMPDGTNVSTTMLQVLDADRDRLPDPCVKIRISGRAAEVDPDRR